MTNGPNGKNDLHERTAWFRGRDPDERVAVRR